MDKHEDKKEHVARMPSSLSPEMKSPASEHLPNAEVDMFTSVTLHMSTHSQNEPKMSLPYWMSDDANDRIPRISYETLLLVLQGKYETVFENQVLVDCRFNYEYEGGHIDGAIRYADKHVLSTQLLGHSIRKRTLLIFYCEFSIYRAPLMASHIRSEDRKANKENWPKLSFPDTYILDGGYKAFFFKHPHKCTPQGYVEMSDTRYQDICEHALGRLRSIKTPRRATTPRILD
jgi:M-phase inducer tyrosine phosphatase